MAIYTNSQSLNPGVGMVWRDGVLIYPNSGGGGDGNHLPITIDGGTTGYGTTLIQYACGNNDPEYLYLEIIFTHEEELAGYDSDENKLTIYIPSDITTDSAGDNTVAHIIETAFHEYVGLTGTVTKVNGMSYSTKSDALTGDSVLFILDHCVTNWKENGTPEERAEINGDFRPLLPAGAISCRVCRNHNTFGTSPFMRKRGFPTHTN